MAVVLRHPIVTDEINYKLKATGYEQSTINDVIASHAASKKEKKTEEWWCTGWPVAMATLTTA